MQITNPPDYRSVLRRALEARCAKNPRYSLRSFARDLGIAPSRLSDVLNGRYGLSRAAAAKIASALGLNNEETARFCDQVESQHARSQRQRETARARIAESAHVYQALTLDGFQVVSDWYHYAILELTLTRGFRSDTAWIASELGISQHVAEAAIERLLRLDLLLRAEDGSIKASDSFTTSPAEVPSDAIKKFHRQVLEKALLAIDFQSLAERDFGSMVVAFDSAQMPAAKAEIKRFRREFDQKFASASSKDSVYCLSTQFFRLTKN